MAVGQYFRCLNRDCGCEVVVINPSSKASFNPRCCCDSEMKKPHGKPVLRTMEARVQFLAKVHATAS